MNALLDSSTMASPSDVLLMSIVAEWHQVKMGFRRHMLHVGEMLHQYLEARIRDGAGMNDAQRKKAGISRGKAILRVAKALRIHSMKVNELIRCAAVVRVLGHPGMMTYTAVEEWRLVIVRKCRGRILRRVKDQPPRPGEYDVSEADTWVLRQGFDAWAPALYKKAADEGWTGKQIRAKIGEWTKAGFVESVLTKERAAKGESYYGNNTTLDKLHDMIEKADPRDVVEMLLELAGHSKNKDMVLRLLKEQL